MKSIIDRFVGLPTWLHSPLWRIWHNIILRVDRTQRNVFLNYGYAGEAGEFPDLPISPDLEPYRYPIQLYCHTVRDHSFPGTDILEVGCGRGGGAAFLASTFKPTSYTAVDINENTTRFCNQRHNVPGLHFLTGDAQNLPFEDGRFDAVVNVESSRCYPDISKFYREVYRVLKPGGRFYYSDMVQPKDLDGLRQNLLKTGFAIAEEKDIRPNVVAALEADIHNRKKEIDTFVPKLLRSSFYEFAGIPGTRRFEIFETGVMGYWSFILVKPAGML